MKEFVQRRLNRKITIVLFMMTIAFHAIGQQDTIYYDAKWKPVAKEIASFYRPPIVKEGDLFKIQDYYMSGNRQMIGYSTRSDKDFWKGKVMWYNEDGSLFQEGNYMNNRLDGDFKTTLNGELIIAKYKNGRLVGGAQNVAYGGRQSFVEYLGDTIKKTIYEKDIKGIRYEQYGTNDTYEVYTKYYGNNGKYLGKKTTLQNSGVNGIEVFYSYGPMQVKEVLYYLNGKALGTSTYHDNGKPRSLFMNKPPYAKVFYDRYGNEKGKISYTLNQGYLKPHNGNDYFYHNPKKGILNSKIKNVRTYNAGKIVEEKEWYESQELKSKTTYNNGSKELILSYDEDGEEIARMQYKNYIPVEGTEYVGNRKLIYKAGKLIEETVYYFDSEDIFNLKTQQKEIFYDQNGNIIGELTLDANDNYPKPIEGKRINLSYENKISSIEEFKNGVLQQRTSFRERRINENENKTYKSIEFYASNGYDRIKEIRFYSNGKKQSEIEFINYKESYGTYYDDNERLLGNYDYKKEEGSLYEFFYDSDRLKLMKTVKDGKLIKMKRYDYGTGLSYDEINSVLVEEINAACCASYYSRDGELLAKVIYKDGEPWEGSIYDHKTFSKYEIKEGKRNGSYHKFGYYQNILEKGSFLNDKEEGLFSYYNMDDEVIKTEHFSQGKLNGISSFYDEDGNELFTMLYKDDLPFEGTRILSSYSKKKPTRESYKNGLITKKVFYDDNGKRMTDYIDGKESKSVAYHGDTEIKRLSYTSKNGDLDGEVVRFDKEGNETHRAIFTKGRFSKGRVLINNNGGVKGGVSYMQLELKPDWLLVKLFSEKGKVLFKAEEDLVFGTNTVFMQNLGIYLDYLKPDRLY